MLATRVLILAVTRPRGRPRLRLVVVGVRLLNLLDVPLHVRREIDGDTRRGSLRLQLLGEGRDTWGRVLDVLLEFLGQLVEADVLALGELRRLL